MYFTPSYDPFVFCYVNFDYTGAEFIRTSTSDNRIATTPRNITKLSIQKQNNKKSIKTQITALIYKAFYTVP